jgi:hypothetical protein
MFDGSTISLQVDDVHLVAQCLSREIHDKAVMGEEDGLKVGTDVC